MNQDEFTKLFKYMQDFRKEVNAKFDEKASQVSLDRLTNAVDSFVKSLDDADIELAARDSQFERLPVWARKISKKTGIPLENL